MTEINITYDGILNIAVGKSRTDKNWINKEIKWSELLKKLSKEVKTKETAAEYQSMTKEEQGKIKDKGGFVGGTLKNGRRKAENILSRRLITLDIDYGYADVWGDIQFMFGNAACIYSTHSHTLDKPRLRLIIPLNRDVTPDEYQAIARKTAHNFDTSMKIFDDTTYEPSRLMYWQSTPKDSDYIFEYQDGPFLNADEVLAEYTFGWNDVNSWPVSERVTKRINNSIKDKQQDPLTKSGVIGAFCRTYSISEAIAEFLSEVYAAGADDTRYTYLEGSTTGGLVVYDDKFSFSHHGTDPTSGILCNAFDLIRIHKFGELDDEVRSDTKNENLPSLKAMIKFANNDKRVMAQEQKENELRAMEEFDPINNPVKVSDDEIKKYEWKISLERNENGKIKASIDNVLIILDRDNMLKDKLAYNEFSLRNSVNGSLPWNKSNKIRYWIDNDDSGLRHYLERNYKIVRAKPIIDDAVKLIFDRNKFHPVKEYLKELKWDGIERMETLLINYFGAEDNIFTRASTRIFLCGAVARIFNPGCQLDYVITIVGPQGIRKGTFYRIMAKYDEWYTELATIKYKDAIEETMGKWIVEMAEMSPTKKSEVEEMKAFITNKSKTIRLAYKHNPTDIDRQYILVASTNESSFLKDSTGNRRYLPIDADMNRATKSIIEDLKNEVDQLYAEAIAVYKAEGYKALMLSKEEEEIANLEQENHRITDDEEGSIIEFLNTPLPQDWYDKDLITRRIYFQDFSDSKIDLKNGFLRDKICVKEIMVELYCTSGKVDLRDSARINKILQGLKNWEKHKNPIKIKGYGTQRVFYRKILTDIQ